MIKVKIIKTWTDGKSTCVALAKATDTSMKGVYAFSKGKSKCSPEDRFNLKDGMCLASFRAENKTLEKLYKSFYKSKEFIDGKLAEVSSKLMNINNDMIDIPTKLD